MILKICLISSCMSHVVKAVKHPEDIVEFYAFRTLNTETNRKEKKGIVKIREQTMKQALINFSGRQQLLDTGYINFPLKEVLQSVNDEEIQDLTMASLALKNSDLYPLVAEREDVAAVIPSEKVAVFEFKRVSTPAKEPYIKRDILNKMGWHIKNLHFQPATMDLIGAYTLKDWRQERNNQLEFLSENKEQMRNIMRTLFKLDGLGKIRYYERGRRNTLLLKECEDI